MKKLFMIFGLFLSTQVFAGNSTCLQNLISSDNCDFSIAKDLITKGSSHRSYLYAYTLDDGYSLASSYYPSAFDYYVPFYNTGEANRIEQIDFVTFLVENKGVFLCSYTLGIEEDYALFALEVTNRYGSYIVDGSQLPFNYEDDVDDPYKTITFLFELEEKDSWVRIVNLFDQDVELEANQEYGVAAAFTLVQIH